MFRAKGIKAIVFDVDDVLLNGCDNEGNILWQKNAERDLGISREFIQEFFFSDMKPWIEAISGNGNMFSVIDKHVVKNNLNIPTQKIVDYILKNDVHKVSKMFEVVELLHEKGYDLYLGTHQVPERADYLWDNVFKKMPFKKMYASCDVGYVKSNTEFFKKVRDDINIPAQELLFLDDKELNANTAIEAGWHGYQHRNYDKTYNEVFKGLL